jgi:NIMA (never in mitosis gene a)-related kinase
MDRKQREDAINEVSRPLSFIHTFCSKVHVLKAMRHPYIITYKESFMDKKCLCIVMDFADGGDLYTKIANQKKIGKGK